MEFDRVHFYVEDAVTSRDWFIDQLGFQTVASEGNKHTQTEVICSGGVSFFLSSPLTLASPVASWLKLHPPGVVDVAFRVQNLELMIAKAVAAGAKILNPIQKFRVDGSFIKKAKVAGWGDLVHTLIEHHSSFIIPQDNRLFAIIDHVVLNVEVGHLEAALNWYQKVFNFQPQQNFEIQTEQSALRSRVMVHPDGGVKLPINEPASANSQIQEFLDANQGSGIQHIALKTEKIIQVVGELRSRGLPFLSVPPSYYQQVRQRWQGYLSEAEWESIEACQILVDNQGGVAEGMLLQIFTQPIFEKPTFFFELIERRFGWVNGQKMQAEGFGEGNFLALFEAIEREQMKRGTLRVEDFC